jgi:hypothetical protein
MTGTLYTATAIGEGPANGATVRVVLGTWQTISPKLALRWLRGQAHRIADGLDPDPRSTWLSGRVIRRLPAGLPDVPAELRQWCADDSAQQAACLQLKQGAPVTVNASDHTGHYSLCVWPVALRAPAPSSSPPEFRPRRDNPGHRKTRGRRGWLAAFFRRPRRAYPTVVPAKSPLR